LCNKRMFLSENVTRIRCSMKLKPFGNGISTTILPRIIIGSATLIGKIAACIHHAEKAKVLSGGGTKTTLRISLGGVPTHTTTTKVARGQEIHGGTLEVSTATLGPLRIHGGSGAVESGQLKAQVDGGKDAATMTQSGERNLV